MVVMNEELSYVSSSPLLATQKPEVKAQDERDLPTLEKVQTLLAERIEAFNTIEYLTFDEKHFTVKEQLAINKSVALNLQEIKLMVDAAITNVRGKYAGR
jgi:hypothetical protein